MLVRVASAGDVVTAGRQAARHGNCMERNLLSAGSTIFFVEDLQIERKSRAALCIALQASCPSPYTVVGGEPVKPFFGNSGELWLRRLRLKPPVLEHFLWGKTGLEIPAMGEGFAPEIAERQFARDQSATPSRLAKRRSSRCRLLGGVLSEWSARITLSCSSCGRSC